MNELEQKAYIFGSIFTLSNNLQTLGDTFDKNITVKQWLFIASAAKFSKPPILSEVAGFIGYSRQNAKRLATALEGRGFVIISKDRDDARALRISLTPKCTAYFKKREQKELEFLDELFTGLDTGLIDVLYKVLLKLEKNINKMGNKHEKEK
jgi:DNA-binding MarR family transcriptional regulator